MALVFVDINVFFSARDDRYPDKIHLSRNWIDWLGTRRVGKTNLQVVNEFTNVVFKKLPKVPPESVFDAADQIAAWGNSPVEPGTTLLARHLRRRYHYSWWDCLLLASALELGCTHFLSEDLQDGQTIEVETGKGLTIVDPFAHTPEQILITL